MAAAISSIINSNVQALNKTITNAQPNNGLGPNIIKYLQEGKIENQTDFENEFPLKSPDFVKGGASSPPQRTQTVPQQDTTPLLNAVADSVFMRRCAFVYAFHVFKVKMNELETTSKANTTQLKEVVDALLKFHTNTAETDLMKNVQ